MEKKLNQKQIQNLKPKKKQYRVPDGGGKSVDNNVITFYKNNGSSIDCQFYR